jgi:hypothetical protein
MAKWHVKIGNRVRDWRLSCRVQVKDYLNGERIIGNSNGSGGEDVDYPE